MTVNVLVVDDEERVLGLAKSTIDLDGSHGIRMAARPPRRATPINPALSLLDMLMPKKGGITVCRGLKELPEMHNVKITLLVVTAAGPQPRPW